MGFKGFLFDDLLIADESTQKKWLGVCRLPGDEMKVKFTKFSIRSPKYVKELMEYCNIFFPLYVLVFIFTVMHD